MEARKENLDINTKQNHLGIIERRLISVMILAVSISTIIFLTHTIIESSMNYYTRQANILSYFTIQSNIIISIWLLAVSLYILTKSKILKWSINIRLSAAVTTYILVTGIIYWAVLIPIYSKTAESSWLYSAPNIWLHTTTPIISFFIFNYIKAINTSQTKSSLLYFYIYPALYITMALIYAANENYLYPIFNPNMLGGWIGVAASIIFIIAIFSGLHILLLKYNPYKKFEK